MIWTKICFLTINWTEPILKLERSLLGPESILQRAELKAEKGKDRFTVLGHSFLLQLLEMPLKDFKNVFHCLRANSSIPRKLWSISFEN